MKIPDRWIDYKAVGDVIEGTRFINFKVPLKETALKANLPNEDWLTTKSLIHIIKEKGYKLGLVIDLTNTKKYYNKEDFEKQGIQYEKIFTEGHKVPSKNIQDRFKEVVNDFLESNGDKDCVIGVHCTHGLNRTGYLVCRYMIDGLDFEPDAAIKAFNNARGHKIERKNYLADLRGQSDLVSEEEGINSESERFYSRDEDNPKNKKRFDSRGCYERTSLHNVHTRFSDDYGGFGRSYNNDQEQPQDDYNYHRQYTRARQSYHDAGCSSASRGSNEGYRSSTTAHNGNQISREANRAGWTSNAHQEHNHISQGARRAGWSSRGSSNVSMAAESAGWTSRHTVGNELSSRDKHNHRQLRDEIENLHGSSGKHSRKHNISSPYSMKESKGRRRHIRDRKTSK